MKITELDSSGQLDPRLGVNIDMLPDDVLLEIFGSCMDDNFDRRHQGTWLRLVHVCRRWRCLVFASPRHLDLRLFCTPRRLLNDLDIWPELPIVIKVYDGTPQPQDVDNIIAVLKQPNRVCKISVEGIARSLLEKFAAIKTPFPALRELKLGSNRADLPVIPDSFMGGSAPRLRGLWLWGISFPSLPKLLSSTTDLVNLTLWGLPHSSYTSPEAMVTYLSTLTKLKSLSLGFQSPRSRANRESRQPPRTVLPALTSFCFRSDSDYLEDFISRIDPPLLNRFSIEFFDPLASDTPLLRRFISDSASFKAPHLADIVFSQRDVEIILFHGKGMPSHRAPRLHVLCRPSDWQPPSPVQFCNSCFPPFPTLERLCIYGVRHSNPGWQGDVESIQWFELLSPFPSVKDLELSANLAQLVAPALGELTEEGVTEVLPALQNIFIEGLQLSESVQESIGRFVSTRQLSGCPVTVRHRERGSWR